MNIPICNLCDRTDIKVSDGDIHVCTVCYLQQVILEEEVIPKLRKILTKIVDDGLLNKEIPPGN